MDPKQSQETSKARGRSSIRGLDVPEVAPVAAAMAKAIAAARLYPAENPTYLNAKKNFDDAIVAALQARRSLRFVVGRHTLFFAGSPVLSEEHGESIASLLHKDGIRELGFHRGLTPEETADLLGLFTRSQLEATRAADDLRTLFWDRGFSHITCVAIDDFLDSDTGTEEIPTEFGQDFMREIDLEIYDLEDEEEVDRAAKEMSEKVASKLAANDVDLFGVTDEERTRLLSEVAAEEDPHRMRHDFARILVEVLLAEDDAASLRDLLAVLSRHMESLLAEGNLLDYSWLLGILVQFRTERPEMDPSVATVVERAIVWIWQGEAQHTLQTKLDRGDMEALQGLAALVEATPDDSLRHLCLLLGDLESGRVRRRLIDLLVARCATSWTVLLPLLGDSRWYLVRNIVLILGQVGNRLIAPSLHRVLKHQDHRVRKEALVALDRLDPARAFSDLKDALVDEERRIRVFAAQTLARRGIQAAPALLAIVKDPAFTGRTEDEVRAVFVALAHAGGPEVMAYLEAAVKPRGLFRKGPSEESRAAATQALGWMEGPKAAALLQLLTKDKSAPVRESAVQALEEARARASSARQLHEPPGRGTKEAA